MKEFAILIDKGWDIYFKNIPKRVNDDFEIRTVWELYNKFNGKILSCEREGFEDSEECINDLISKLKENKLKID